MHIFLNHNKSVAIIGGYAAKNMQNIAAIQTNANQMVKEMQTSLMTFDAFTKHRQTIHRKNGAILL
jgi:hypothetical protein